MTRPATIALLVACCAGCGGATSVDAAASRPVRVADHVTEAEPTPEAETTPETTAVTPPEEDGPRADPPPVEPPSFEE